jgi:hypothetical protein
MPKILLAGLILGVTAAAIVWFLERFEGQRLHSEVREYLERYDEFRAWLASRPEMPGQGPAPQGPQ